VNASPSLTADTASDHELKCGMLEDMLDVLDLEEKRSGDELQVHLNLNCQSEKRSTIVFN
jgi:tubulin polyglutamylase TTLL9